MSSRRPACGRCGGRSWAMRVNFLYGWLCSRCTWILDNGSN